MDPGSRADKEKKALFSAATKVTDLTTNIGTEIEGLQLKDLTDQQKDELALLVAERSVVFFREQDLSPQDQKKLGEWFGEVEIHVSGPIYEPPAPKLTLPWAKASANPRIKSSPKCPKCPASQASA